MYLHPFKNQYRDQDFTLIADTIKEYCWYPEHDLHYYFFFHNEENEGWRQF